MKNKILETIRKYHLISPGDILVAAVSGGPDSMAMLHVIGQLTRDWGVKIHVAHFNHMFRGKEAEEEAHFVSLSAREMGLDCTVETVDVPAYLEKNNLSPEEGARNLRYDFLRRVAFTQKADFIMTAHHANDQAETVLLHLLRGAGPEGLAAISPREGNLIRPMLAVTKEEIINYCRENNLAYRLDPTNNQDIYTRNQIRLNLIPALRQFNPRIVSALAKTADICREDHDLLKEITQEALKKINVSFQDQKVMLDKQEFASFHPALKRRVIRQIIDDFTGFQGYLSFAHTDEILALKPGKELCLPGPIYAKNAQGQLIFSKVKESRERIKNVAPLRLNVPGNTYVPELNIKVDIEIVDSADLAAAPLSKGKYVQYFNQKILGGELWVRNRLPGDRFRPKGMRGTKKLKDFMIDEKIPLRERREIPLILAGNEIIWLVGYRTGEAAKISVQDEKIVIIKVERHVQGINTKV